MTCAKTFKTTGGCLILMILISGDTAWGESPPTLLLPNGDFERPDSKVPAKPAGWFMPDGLGVQWTNDPDSTAHGKCIRLNTAVSEKAMVDRWQQTGLTNFWNIPKPAGNTIAETYGLSYYSDALPVKSNQAYRVTFDYKGSGGGKVWIRCYGFHEGEMRRRYEKVILCEGRGNEWSTQSSVFQPSRQRTEVSEMKVMLYAYYPPGLYWFDNLRIVPISQEEYTREKGKTGR
ncbi:MAG: hypothetical protein WCI95_05380 [bacterium]